MTSHTNNRNVQRQRLIQLLNELQGATESNAGVKVVEKVAEEFYNLLKELSIELLPYAPVSQFVYNNKSEDLMYFIEKLDEMINNKYQNDNNEQEYIKGLKLLEHMELAKQQKDSLFDKQESEIRTMKSISELNLSRTGKIKELQDVTKALQEENKNIISNFISILGIFAAILMGAFGAIQGFTSIFDNAHRLDLSIILIISSIGGSSVILILFFLLNSIAKLTDRDLSNTKVKDSPLIEKHPSVVVIFGLLTLIALIGAALELSNTTIHYSPQGFWWIIPFIWLIYLSMAINKKRLWPFKDTISNISNVKENKKIPTSNK